MAASVQRLAPLFCSFKATTNDAFVLDYDRAVQNLLVEPLDASTCENRRSDAWCAEFAFATRYEECADGVESRPTLSESERHRWPMQMRASLAAQMCRSHFASVDAPAASVDAASTAMRARSSPTTIIRRQPIRSNATIRPQASLSIAFPRNEVKRAANTPSLPLFMTFLVFQKFEKRFNSLLRARHPASSAHLYV